MTEEENDWPEPSPEDKKLIPIVIKAEKIAAELRKIERLQAKAERMAAQEQLQMKVMEQRKKEKEKETMECETQKA